MQLSIIIINYNTFSLTSSVPLFEGFTLVNTLKRSRLDYLGSRMDLQKVRNDMALNVATVYLQVLYNRELLAVADDQCGGNGARNRRPDRYHPAAVRSSDLRRADR